MDQKEREKKSGWRCPYCDALNDWQDSICQICGEGRQDDTVEEAGKSEKAPVQRSRKQGSSRQPVQRSRKQRSPRQPVQRSRKLGIPGNLRRRKDGKTSSREAV